MGEKMLGGKPEARYNSCYADTGPDGYGQVPPVYLGKGRSPVFAEKDLLFGKRETKARQKGQTDASSVPEHGGCV